MSQDLHHPDRLKDLLLDAIERPAEQRRAYLEQATGGDQSLLQRVLELVDAWERATTVLRDDPASSQSPLTPSAFDPMREGDKVGPYIIGKRIGEGGFGVVHRARQEEPVKRELAIKILKAGFGSRAVLARFEGERQALARLTHPSIARIIDAGATAQGVPYFAMELVEGEPITTYCDQRKLPIEARLRLFGRVCHAVQHAHQKGIIHRDLKPSNILIADVDGQPLPKVIDFGIAKAIDEPLTDSSIVTMAHQVIGTPRYMSPEQASFAPGAIDTRSDIFSLGVILYELLCGTTPLSDETLRGVALSDLARLLRESRFPKPSTRLSTAVDARDAAARARAAQPDRLERQLASDLDWLVMRAIEPEPERRYQTALAFARDIERYLAHEPIDARPPGRAYLARKFMRRHRVPVVAGAVVSLALLTGLGFALYGLDRAARDRDAAEASLAEATAVTDFLSRTLSSVDPAAKGKDVKVADLLVDASEQLHESFKGTDATKGRLHHVIGTAFWALGDWKNAEREMRSSVLLRETALGPISPGTLTSLANLSAIVYEQGDVQRALPLSQRVVDGLLASVGEENQQTIGAMSNHSLMLKAAGNIDQAYDMQRRVVELNEKVFGPDHGRTIGSIHNLGNTLLDLDRPDDAEAMLLDALRRGERALGADAPETVLARESLATFYHKLNRHTEARPLMTAVVDDRRRIYGDTHPQTLLAIYNLGANAMSMDEFDRAVPLFAEVLRASPSVIPARHPVTQATITNLAIIHQKIGWERMDPALTDKMAEISRLVGDQNVSIGYRNVVAVVMASLEPESARDPEFARRIADRVCAEAESSNDSYIYGYLDTLALAHFVSGRVQEAIEIQKRAVALAPTDDPELADMEQHLQAYLVAAERVAQPSGDVQGN